MTNPWLQFAGGQEAPGNPWLRFTETEEQRRERMRKVWEERRRAGDEQAALDLPEPGEGRPGIFGSALKKARKVAKAGVAGVLDMPRMLGFGADVTDYEVERAREYAEEQGREFDEETYRRVHGPARGARFAKRFAETSRQEEEAATEQLAEATAHLPTPVAAGINWGADVAGMMADPLELLPGGLAARGATAGARALKGGRRAVGAAEELVENLPRAAAAEPGLAELARRSLEINASEATTRRAATVVDVTPEGAGAVRYYRAMDDAGQPVGSMTFTAEPGGGFRVMDVETVGKGTGGMRAMMIKANRETKGPYLGSFAETDEGAAALARLRGTDPELFVGPEIHVRSGTAGEAGYVKIPLGKPPGTPGFLTRWFSNWGDYAAMGKEIGEEFAETKRLATAAVKTEAHGAEMLVRDAESAIKKFHKELPGERPLEETMDYVLSGLEGEHVFEGAPMYLRNAVEAARGHLDSLSEQFDTVLERALREDLIKSPEWQERAKDLRSIIKANKGKWVRRSFEAFTNGDWADLVKNQASSEHWRWTNFLDWAKKELAATEPGLADDVLQARAEGLANKYLRRDPEVFFGIGQKTLIPRETLGSAKKRLDLPQQIDDLLGLHKDPLIRYRESVTALAHDIETLKLKTDLLEKGRGTLFFDEPLGEASELIHATTGLDPLAGKYTTPEVHAVVSAISATRDEASKTWVRHLAKASSLVKAGKTVGSPFVTHPRNLFSWVPFITANGNMVKALNPRRWARAARTVKAGKFGANVDDAAGAGQKALAAISEHVHLADGRRLSDATDYSLDALRARHLKLQRAGVIGESVTAGDVAHYRGVLGEVKSLKSWKNERVSRGVAKAWKSMEWLYGAEDDIGKIIAFDAAEQDLKWARAADYKGLDDAGRKALDEEIFQEAARRTRETTPTYSKITPFTRELRDFPVLSAFPTFSQEIYRNTKNGLKVALSDLRRTDNPRMQILGAKRLAGLVAATGMAPTLAVAGMKATGVSREAVDALREFVPPWDKNANLAPLELDGWSFGAVNLSYMKPHSIFTEPIIAAWIQSQQDEGPVEDIVDATLGAAWETVEPFASRDILVDGMIDYIWKTRGTLWDANAPLDVNARAVANAIYRTAAPGGVLWLERVAKAAGAGEAIEEDAASQPEGPSRSAQEFIASLLQEVNQYGTEYDLSDELIAGGTGIRLNHYDVAKSMRFAGRRFMRNYSDASDAWNRAKNHPGGLPPTTVAGRKREAEAKFREGWDQLRRQVEAMRKIGRESGKPDYIIERDVAAALDAGGLGKKWTRSVMTGRYVSPYE